MNDINFNLSYMSIVSRDCYGAENEVKSSINGFASVAKHMESELSSFSGEGTRAVREIQAKIYQIRDLKGELDRKSDSAKNKKQKEIQPPQRPSIPEKATPEQRNAIMSAYHQRVSQIEAKNAEIRKQNERIDAYVQKCDEAKGQLEEIISHLHQLEEATKSEIENTVTRVHQFTGQAHGIMTQNARVNTAMQEFTHAFREAYESAERLYLAEPSSIHSYSYVDKQFVIKNTRA